MSKCRCNVKEAVNKNRMVPVFDPKIKENKVEPKIDKSPKGKIGGTTNNMTTDMWKKILDSQLSRNAKK